MCFQQITPGTAFPALTAFTSKAVCHAVAMCDLTSALALPSISLLKLNKKTSCCHEGSVGFCVRLTAGVDCSLSYQFSGWLLQKLSGEDVQRGGGDELRSM